MPPRPRVPFRRRSRHLLQRPQHHHPVFVHPQAQPPPRQAHLRAILAGRRRLPVHPPPAAHQPLHLLCGRPARHRQQPRLGERAGRAEVVEVGERGGDAQLLARGTEIEAGASGQRKPCQTFLGEPCEWVSAAAIVNRARSDAAKESAFASARTALRDTLSPLRFNLSSKPDLALLIHSIRDLHPLLWAPLAVGDGLWYMV